MIMSGSAIYQIGCDVGFTVEKGGSSEGAGRVCANLEKGTPVDIGDMSRGWKSEEAEESLGFLYECLQGDKERSALQVPVAIDGVTVATDIDGPAAECIEILGGKLTPHHLRWIYSNYTEIQLEATGWDSASLQKTDGDPSTHLWSELDKRCQPLEIYIAGPDESHGTYDFFVEVILTDSSNGETFAKNRKFNYDGRQQISELVLSLQQVESSIAYFGYSYYYANRDSLLAVQIQNDKGDFVTASHDTISDSSYNPLSRPVFMNVRNDKVSLENTVPFVSFALGFMAKRNVLPWTLRLQTSSRITSFEFLR